MDKPAIIKCLDCSGLGESDMRLCWPCDNKTHGNGSILQKHKKEMIPYNG